MSCTAEEIAEKKRQALERLKQKKNQSVASEHAKSNTNPVTSPTAKSFYGNSSKRKAEELTEYENKIKHSSNPHTSNRILSQPYSNRDKKTTQSNAPSTSNTTANNKVASIFQKVVTCSCSMLTETRFQVTVTGYHSKLIDVFKSIPTRCYGESLGCQANERPFKMLTLNSFTDNDTKIWSFNLNDYDLLQERVARLNPDVVIGSLPKFVLNLLKRGFIFHSELIHNDCFHGVFRF